MAEPIFLCRLFLVTFFGEAKKVTKENPASLRVSPFTRQKKVTIKKMPQ
jgi:hypothetical protein